MFHLNPVPAETEPSAYTFMDTNVVRRCLKVLTIIVECFQKSTDKGPPDLTQWLLLAHKQINWTYTQWGDFNSSAYHYFSETGSWNTFWPHFHFNCHAILKTKTFSIKQASQKKWVALQPWQNEHVYSKTLAFHFLNDVKVATWKHDPEAFKDWDITRCSLMCDTLTYVASHSA